MLATLQKQFALSSPGNQTRSRTLFWFSLAMTCGAVFSLLAMRVAFSREYIVQDDARQHVFWMRRFLDPELFPGDWIADYFQSVAPSGFTTIYRVVAAAGIDPILLNKLLPIALILTTTAYCFFACLEILPVPIAGFMASLVLNQNLILADDVNSATPRSFLYPFFLAFLYYLMRRSTIPCLVTIALQGLFYPQILFVSCGILILQLVRWQEGRLQLARDRQTYILTIAGLVVGGLTVLLYLLTKGGEEFGPAISAAQARLMPEFWAGGRGSFFNNDPVQFWLFAGRSGIFPHPHQLFKPPLILAGLVLPLVFRFPQRFPLVHQVTDRLQVIGYAVLSSVGLFFAAHLLLFKLHHPSRYTQHSFRMLLALTAGVTLAIVVDALLHWVDRQRQVAQRAAGLGLVAIVAASLLLYPGTVRLKDTSLGWLVPNSLLHGYAPAREPDLYEFFADQPKDILIASLAMEANNLPTHARRSILVGREYGIPYHVGYYTEFRQRSIDLIRAQYTQDASQVRDFVNKYGIDFWLVDREAFTPEYFESESWLQQYQPVASEAIASLQRGTVPLVQQAIDRCQSFSNEQMVVLKAACVVEGK